MGSRCLAYNLINPRCMAQNIPKCLWLTKAHEPLYMATHVALQACTIQVSKYAVCVGIAAKRKNLFAKFLFNLFHEKMRNFRKIRNKKFDKKNSEFKKNKEFWQNFI